MGVDFVFCGWRQKWDRFKPFWPHLLGLWS